MEYTNYGYAAHESNIKMRIINYLTQYEEHIEQLDTIISDKDNEIDDLRIENEILQEKIQELEEQLSYMQPISQYEHTGISEKDFI